MPPLGPPFVTPSDRPPPPRYPLAPPEQWPPPPPLIPTPEVVAAPPSWWSEARRRQVLVWGAIAVVIGVIVGVAVANGTSDGLRAVAPLVPTTSSSESSSQESSPRESTTTTTEPQDLNAVVLEIEKFVERERGLKFKQPVAVRLAGEGEFQRLLLSDFDKQRPALGEEQQVLTALGLVPKGTDVVQDERSLLSIGVVGFYDPETKQLVVRGAAITPYVRQVLAHELTHALDDQWFDLNRPQLDNPDDESGFGFLGLIEGNARRIENAYLASLPQTEQAQAVAEEARLVAQHPEIFRLPPVLLTLAQAPYDQGPPFVQALLAAGGQARLDAAFASPPVTSEQVLDPKRYLAGEGPVAVPNPPADGPAANVGALGELLLREMLFESLTSGSEINRAITGWGGDRYVTWTDAAGKTCLRDAFVGDTPSDTQELVQAIGQWAGDHSGVLDAPADGAATFTVCA
jgi:hypothetical protein